MFMNLATRTEFCLFHVSGLLHSNSTVSPWWEKPWTVTADGVGPPTAETTGVAVGAIDTDDVIVCCGCIVGVGAGADEPNGSIIGEPIGADGAGAAMG